MCIRVTPRWPGSAPRGLVSNHELDIIERLGFPGYFLVVWDMVNYARDQDIMCQIRGSGADSAVCRCLGLTRVDPIRLHLPFERFLSEERGRPPDIDLDLEADRREEVIQYCYRRYGRERAAMVANVITYRAQIGITRCRQDVRVHPGTGRRDVEIRGCHVTPEFAASRGATSRRSDCRVRLRRMPTSGRFPPPPRYPFGWGGDCRPARCGKSFRSSGGRMADRTVLQWDKDDCAAIGVVKFDLLGLGMLNALHLTIDSIAEVHGQSIDLATIPQERAVYEMMTKADTVGLFQIESRAQMATLPRMKPKTFYDLAVEVALIRPGPIQGASVHPYLRRRNGEEPIRYPHPLWPNRFSKRPSACQCFRNS